MKGKKSIMRRLIATCATVALTVSTMAFSVSADVAQRGSSDYIGFDISAYGFNVYGKNSSNSYLKTTFGGDFSDPSGDGYQAHGGGYSTFLTVDGSTVYTSDRTPGTPGSMTPTFRYGEDYSVNDASVNITASINSSGKGVLLTYTITNNSDSDRTMSVGSCSDCQIASNDSALVRSYEDGLSMNDNNGNVFYLLPVSDEFTTLWSGYYGYRYSNLTTNEGSHSYTGDSGLVWSWSVNVPAHGTATRTCIISCGETQVLTRHTVNFDANGGEGSMDSRTFVDGVESILPANTFTREGYDFMGWSTSADSDEVAYANQGAIALTADTTLYAVWSLHRDPSSCTAPEGLSLTYNGAAQELVTPGSTSDGTMVYSLDENGEFTSAIPTGTASGTYTVYYMVQGNATHFDSSVASVEATISPLTVPVSIDGNRVAEISAEEAYAQPEAPSRYGYDFAGWYADSRYTTEYDFTQPVGIDGAEIFTKWETVSYDFVGAPVASEDGLTFTVERNINEPSTYSHFTGVKVDGEELSTDNYVAISGSVILTLNADYMNSLSNGTHSLELMFDDADSATTTFTVGTAPAATTTTTTETTAETTPTATVLGVQRAPETTPSEETTTTEASKADAEATATPTPTTAPSNTVSTGEASNASRIVMGIILLAAGAVVASRYMVRTKEERK